MHRINLYVSRQRGLIQIATGNNHTWRHSLFYLNCHGENTIDCPRFTFKRQLSHHNKIIELCTIKIAIGRQYTQGNGQIKGRPLLFGISRRKIHRYSLVCRKIKTRILDGRSDPLLTFIHRLVRETYDSNTRHTISNIYLHSHQAGINSRYGHTVQLGKHHNHPLFLLMEHNKSLV